MMDVINLENAIQSDEPVARMNIEDSERSKTITGNHKGANTQGESYQQSYSSNRNIAEGMMDLALLTANANQMRFLLAYNSKSPTYYVSLWLIVFSLILQVAVGIALIFKRKNGKKSRMLRTNQFLISGVFMVTFVNILVAAFTSTDNNAK